MFLKTTDVEQKEKDLYQQHKAKLQLDRALEGNEMFKQALEEVLELDAVFDLLHTNEFNTENLGFTANALAGEVGELCNVVKKIWRDGESPELWRHYDEEIVDVVIYLVKMIIIGRTKFDAAWVEKHEGLYEKGKQGKRFSKYNLLRRQLRRD